MSVLLVSDPRFLAHDTGPGHPERPARLQAVLAGIEMSGVADALVHVVPRRATQADLERVHPGRFLTAIEEFCHSGGGSIDTDTHVGPRSWEAAVLAAGAGLEAVARLERGEADAAFCAVRPPGHHALPARAMGFCLVNNVAVAGAALADRGERVLVVDFDAHHGNGTQDAFYTDGRVAYVSLHEYPLYPGTGRLTETGEGAGAGLTVNIPLPAGATGDVYLAAVDELVAPLAERIGATWLLLSAGFDAHRADPLTSMGLTAGDYADLTARLGALVPRGRRIAFLEGGYDLQALADSAGATVAALAGETFRPERSSSGGPGRPVVEAARRLHDLATGI